MKTSIIALFLVSGFAFSEAAGMISEKEFLDSQLTIDSNDTVVFNLALATMAGSFIEFPVSMLSNDTINALDFSFKYNHASLDFDTIITLAPYLQSVYYYSTVDSTVRFTSFSMQPVANDSPLVMVRFELLSGQLCSSELNTLLTYLNGDACSPGVVECIPDGVDESGISSHMISLFPNPASSTVAVSSTRAGELILTSSDGKMMTSRLLKAGDHFSLSVGDWPSGLYVVRLVMPEGVSVKKLLVCH